MVTTNMCWLTPPLPNQTPNRKANATKFKFVRVERERDEWMTAYTNANLSVADIITKTLPAGEKRIIFVRIIIQHL